jgi:hypothetical protein
MKRIEEIYESTVVERDEHKVSKKYKVPERELLGYFEKEMLAI